MAPTPTGRAEPMDSTESTKTLRCGSFGLSGRLYVPGLSRSRKNAFSPPRKSPGSAPYNRAFFNPMPLSFSTRFFALATSSSLKPNWIESVGHAFAQAGPSPLWIRSLQKVHLLAVPVSWLKATTPNGQDDTQYG